MTTAKSQLPVRIAICISTYLRPIGLTRLMSSLSKLTFDKNRDVALQIIVIDNDNAGSAQTVVKTMAPHIESPVLYAMEPRRGIPFARNQAVAFAEGSDFIVFVDDDEIVHAAWLDELVFSQKRFDADVVTGPVIPIFESEPPKWVLEGKFFDRRRYSTGTPLHYARTGNVLIKRRVLDKIDGPFDTRFALSGGEDTFLFMQLAQSGAHIVWCDEAIVSEFIPKTRVTTKWLVQRAYRGGNSQALCEMALQPTIDQITVRILKGCIRVGQGFLGLLPSLCFGYAAIIRMLSRIALGLGMIAGVLGYSFKEYRKVHGA